MSALVRQRVSRASIQPSIEPTGEAEPEAAPEAAHTKEKKRPIEDTLALIAELDKMQITAQWIKEEFLSKRLGTFELSERTSKQSLEVELHERLSDHAIYSHKQLEDVAMQAGGVVLLQEILECKGAAEAISKYYDNLNALKESFAPKWKSIELALTGDLEAMDAFLMNFGLAAALIGGAAMSNFTSITKEDIGDRRD
jgi:hypothetical protein